MPSTRQQIAVSVVRSSRREGLYFSHIVEWRKAADAGARSGLTPAIRDRRDREIEQLRARAEKAEAELARTRAALDLVGKAHALLETLSESAEPPSRQSLPGQGTHTGPSSGASAGAAERAQRG